MNEIFDEGCDIALNNMREFFEWAKKNGACKVKAGDIEVEFVPDLGLGFSDSKPPPVTVDGEGSPVKPAEEDDEVLYQSSG